MSSSVSGRTSANAGDFPHFPLVRYPAANRRSDLSFFLGVGVPEMRTNLLKDRRACIICVRPSERLWTVGPLSKAFIPIRRAPDAARQVVDEGADLHRHESLAGIDGVNRAGRRLPGIEHASQCATAQRLRYRPRRQYGDADAVERCGTQRLRV